MPSKRYIGKGFREVGVKLSEDLDEKIEALTYHSIHRKKWRVINELLAQALHGMDIPTIPEEARDDFPLNLPPEKPQKKAPTSHPKKAKKQ
jgi:hypothetical protein